MFKAMLASATISTPVLFLIYNRPDLTFRVFEVIRTVKPSRLYIAADGPRPGKVDDAGKCQAARGILDRIDWACEVKTLFREENIGCRLAVSSAIDWFFEREEQGIILEDDCLPSKSFFGFCQELLVRYRNDERIMQINGNNFLKDKVTLRESYYFSKLSGSWGWATWSRAWRHFDLKLREYQRFKEDNRIRDYLSNKEMIGWIMSYFEDAVKPSCSVWSTQWSYAILIQNGLCIYPRKNLIKNIGFSNQATHGTKKSFKIYSQVDLEEMDRLKHPVFVLSNNECDRIFFEVIKKADPRLIHGYRVMSGKLKNKIKRFFANCKLAKKYK